MTDFTISHAFGSSETFFEKLAAFFARRTKKKRTRRASDGMLNLCWNNLDVRLQMIDETALQTECQKRTYHALEEQVRHASGKTGSDELDWDDLAKAESFLALLLSGAALRQEICMRLQDAAGQRVPDVDTLRCDFDALPRAAGEAFATDDTVLRPFLLRVLEAIQWNGKRKYLAQPVRQQATKRVLLCAFVAFAFIVAPYLQVGLTGWSEVGKGWSLFAIHTAVASGLLGACFSRLMSVQRCWNQLTLDEASLQREWSYILLRAGIGVCGALIAYLFLRAQFLTGTVFPDFAQVSIQYVQVEPDKSVGMAFVMPSKDLALLNIWCLVAGFSEMLVPGMLTSSEQQLTQAAAPRKDR